GDRAAEHHGKDEAAVHAHLLREGLLRDARIAAHVAHPQRLAARPHVPDQALATRESQPARALAELLHRTAGPAPCLAKAQAGRGRVDLEVASGIPALRLADGTHHFAQGLVHGTLVGERARHRVLERHQPLLAPAVGGVAADAAVAEELAVRAEYRLAAER